MASFCAFVWGVSRSMGIVQGVSSGSLMWWRTVWSVSWFMKPSRGLKIPLAMFSTSLAVASDTAIFGRCFVVSSVCCWGGRTRFISLPPWGLGIWGSRLG